MKACGFATRDRGRALKGTATRMSLLETITRARRMEKERGYGLTLERSTKVNGREDLDMVLVTGCSSIRKSHRSCRSLMASPKGSRARATLEGSSATTSKDTASSSLHTRSLMVAWLARCHLREVRITPQKLAHTTSTNKRA